jgi:OpgC protein
MKNFRNTLYYTVVKPGEKRRIYEFDLLRGIFIVIIIIDHLQFWPSPLSYITGEGRLWVSAAEGFFLISGLLVGYIRAYKDRFKPLWDTSKKLLQRALMLYLWGIGITFAITGFTLAIGGHAMLPMLPNDSQLSSPVSFIWAVLSGNYFNSWIYFLRLYAIMLAITPLFLWLLRKRQERVIIALMALAYATSFVWPEGGLQWQVLFFGAALLGYKLEAIGEWLNRHRSTKIISTISLVSATIVTMILSYFFVLSWGLVENPNWHWMNREQYVAIRAVIDPWFSSNPMAIGRIVLAFLWMGGLFMFVHTFRRFVMKWLGWLLIPLGGRSLSAYCLQALILPLIVVTIPLGDPLYNTIIALGVVLLCWALLRVPLIKRLLPV